MWHLDHPSDTWEKPHPCRFALEETEAQREQNVHPASPSSLANGAPLGTLNELMNLLQTDLTTYVF